MTDGQTDHQIKIQHENGGFPEHWRQQQGRPILSVQDAENGDQEKTKIVNMAEIARALARPASDITRYFGTKIGAQSKFQEKQGASLVNGDHPGHLENFISKYVQCYECKNPEAEIVISKTQMIQTQMCCLWVRL